MTFNHPLTALRHHVSGAIERGEKEPIVAREESAMESVSEYEVLKKMEECGGSFASNLARAWQRADLSNKRKLMQAFGDLYQDYEAMTPIKPDFD